MLNSHNRHPNGYCGLDVDKLALLDRIVTETGCRIVLVSAWRYLILSGSMTLKGFGNLLYTHGAGKATVEALLDWLPPDRHVNSLCDRGRLAREWLQLWPLHGEARYLACGARPPVTHAVALDDGSWPDGFDLGYEVVGIPGVRPKPTVGLTEAEAERVIELLGKIDAGQALGAQDLAGVERGRT